LRRLELGAFAALGSAQVWGRGPQPMLACGTIAVRSPRCYSRWSSALTALQAIDPAQPRPPLHVCRMVDELSETVWRRRMRSRACDVARHDDCRANHSVPLPCAEI
jgi:hypothetical protein